MVNMHLTPEQSEFRDMLKDFVSNEIKPKSIKSDRLQPFDKPLMENLVVRLSELGLRSLNLSEEAGGVGADLLTSCIILEELAIGDVDIAITLGHTALLSKLLFDKTFPKSCPICVHPLALPTIIGQFSRASRFAATPGL